MLDDFFMRALIAGIGLALVTGPAGCFVVWRRLAYFGETIAHSSLLGVALAIVLQFNLVVGILISAALVAFIMFYLDRRGTLPTDTLLGLLAHGGLALGLVILSFFPSMRIDLHGLLFGDILAVQQIDLAVIWGAGAVVLGVLAWLWRPLLAATVNPDLAAVAGLKPERARLIFGLLVAAIIAVAIKIVGILLIVALLIIPAATARRFAPSPEWMAVGAAAVGASATVGGLYASATWDTPSGPSIVVTALALFAPTSSGRWGNWCSAGDGNGLVGAALQLDLHGDVADVETVREALLNRGDG